MIELQTSNTIVSGGTTPSVRLRGEIRISNVGFLTCALIRSLQLVVGISVTSDPGISERSPLWYSSNGMHAAEC